MLFLRYSADKLFANFGSHFCSFAPFLVQKIRMFKKFKKNPRNTIILHTLRCLKNVRVKMNGGSEYFTETLIIILLLFDARD